MWLRALVLDDFYRSSGGRVDPHGSTDSDGLDELVARTEGGQPGRRLFHAVNGLAIWAFLSMAPIGSPTAAALFGGAFLVALGADLLRLRFPALNRLFFQSFPHFASPRERDRIASSTWYIGGVALALLFFPRAFAEAGVLVLALADPAASWFGRIYGRRSFGTGSVFGSVLFYAVTVAVLWPVVGLSGALAVAVVVTLAEVVPWTVDDNLVVPLATAASLWLWSGWVT